MTSPPPSATGGQRLPSLKPGAPSSHQRVSTDEQSAEDQELEVGEDDGSELAVDVDEELVLANGDSDDDDQHDRRGGGRKGSKAARFSLPSIGRKKGGRYSRVIPEGGELPGRSTSDSGRRAAAAAVAAVNSVTSALSSSVSPSSALPPPPSASTSIRSCLTVSNCLLCLVFSLTIVISGFVGWTIARRFLQSSAASHPITIVVSLDGFRASYYTAYPELSPNLHSISKAGVYVRRLVPAFPSSTFPNHYTLMTGLYPPEHGIVANRMYNAETGLSFTVGSNSTLDPVWWKGEPLWVTARRWGLKTAALQWPGSDVLIDNMRPDVWSLYNNSLPGSQLLDTALGWLDDQSCQLCLLYFPDVDVAGHAAGPDSELVQAAIAYVDGLIGRLIAGLSSRGLLDAVNLVVLSDHGMTAVNASVSSSTTLYIDDYVNDTAVYRLVDWGANAALLPLCNGSCAEALYDALRSIPNVTVYWNHSIPDALHYSHNALIQPILIVCDLGFLVTDRGAHHHISANLKGAHGYLPWLLSMSALMTLRGPSLVQSTRGSELAEVHSVDVYALLCYMLRIAPAKNEGNLTQWIPLLNV